MNNGFVRSIRFLINNIFPVIPIFFAVPIGVCYLNWYKNGNLDLRSTLIFSVTIIASAFCTQHYTYFYKTAKSLGITGKSFLAACHVNKLLLSVIITATAWLTRCLINFYEFTPHMLGILFLSSFCFGFLGEFCGVVLYKLNFKYAHLLIAIFTGVYVLYIILFEFIVFHDSIDIIILPVDTFLLVSALIFSMLSLILLILTNLISKNLEIGC